MEGPVSEPLPSTQSVNRGWHANEFSGTTILTLYAKLFRYYYFDEFAYFTTHPDVQT